MTDKLRKYVLPNIPYIPVPIIPKFRVGHYALHNTVSMRVLF